MNEFLKTRKGLEYLLTRFLGWKVQDAIQEIDNRTQCPSINNK